ncbi:MAG TPA: hypothetical protein VEJ16_13975 [Alphaproteobacteria bacterium]|nr:hypothetical protein [Alphaproteobacteria bacterium]
MSDAPHGFDEMARYPLLEALLKRRSRRIGLGLKTVGAGENTYTSNADPQPLSELEEAVLIAAIGLTGLTMPDRPFESPTGEKILGTPNLNMPGRAAGSTDNAQATHFFLFNDTGTYFLKRLDTFDPTAPLTPELLINRARACKVKIFDKRPEFPREFPYYLDSNRFLSNLPGSTILFPVVDMTRQYINALMYLLTEPDGFRPLILDDRNFYLPAGVWKWIRRGFLNKDIKLPLGVLGTMRTQIEAELLLQNLILMLQAMGLGGWIHASVAPIELFPALGFKIVTPPYRLFDFLRWGTFVRSARSHPVGLDPHIVGMCPPYYESMADAVQAVIDSKYGPGGTYNDAAYFRSIFKGNRGERYLSEVPHYQDDVIACVKDICTYIYKTHGRFPAHCDAMFAPGVWLQAHHLDLDYYDTLFKGGYTDTQRQHQQRWHGSA